MTAIGAWSPGQQNLTGDGEPVRIGVGSVTANLFDVLGARPLLGRMFTAEEDVPNGPQVAILGYPLWQSRYGGDAKLMRVHKRLLDSHRLGNNQTRLHAALNAAKQAADRAVLGNRELLGTPDYFEKQLMPIVLRSFRDAQPPGPDADTCRLINRLLAREYLDESQGRLPFG